MKQWYRKLLKLQKPYHWIRAILSIIGLMIIFGLIIAGIDEVWMNQMPVLAWTLMVVAACAGIALITVLIRYDLKNRKKQSEYWNQKIQRQNELESSENRKTLP